jgi:N-glycosylase/DNA lyase
VERGTIALGEIPGGFDMQATVESGQSYLWTRADGRTYESEQARGGSAWYWTVVDGEVIRARQVDDALEWEATTDAGPHLWELLGLGDDLDAIAASAPSDDLVDAAYDAYRGLRIVRDPFFPCLVSFICSAQMRVARIFEMQASLRETYGVEHSLGGETYHAFPTSDRLAETTEADLRDLGLGYRAPYVRRTAEMVASGELTRADVEGAAYEDAREALTGFVGVGPKVADCVLLFSLGYLEAVPLDTWIRTAIEDHYPDCAKGSYAETSRAIRERFGGEYAGYTQTYVFAYLRTRE